jgi:hypothetical protein
VAAFCRDEGVSVASFYQWRRRLSNNEGESGAESPGGSPSAAQKFRPVQLTAAFPSFAVTVRLPSGVVIEAAGDMAANEVLDRLLGAVGRGDQQC